MKKILLLIIVFVINTTLIFAQKKSSEYKYIGIKISAVNNFSFPPADNNNVLIRSPYGDLMKQNNTPLTYTPGAAFSIIYNNDNRNDKRGIAFGIDVQNYGFQNVYKSTTSDFILKNQYRVTSIGIPVYLKIWNSNIYKNQLYATVGAEFNYFLNVYNYQTASWNALQYIRKMPVQELNKMSFSAMLGFNYNVFFINFQLLSSNFLNKDYIATIEEGTIYPYKDLNLFNNLTVQTGINIPLTRWLTARNWAAEKTRRILKGSK